MGGGHDDGQHVQGELRDLQGQLMTVIIISNATEGGSVPSGPAGGDLSGDYPDPVVAQSSAATFTVENALKVMGGTDVGQLNVFVGLDMEGQQINGLANGVLATDAAALGQVGVTSVAAGDTSIVVGGTASAPTIETGTLDVIAADHPPAGNWSNNSKKITSLANGSGAQDAAAFGQIPTSAGSIGGLLAANNLSDVANAGTALANLAGAPLASPALTGSPTAPTQSVGDSSTKIATDAFVAAAVGPYAKQTLASAAASITFSSIPAGYSLLRVLVLGASSKASEVDQWAVTVNGDSGAHDDSQYLSSQHTTNAAGILAAQDFWVVGENDVPGTSATAGVPGILDIQIPNYAGTTWQKTGLWRSGYIDAATSSSDGALASAVINWRSAAAITSVTIALASGDNLITGSVAYLYLS
jgi:hypothetical protein